MSGPDAIVMFLNAKNKKKQQQQQKKQKQKKHIAIPQVDTDCSQ